MKHPPHIQILATPLIPYKALMGGRPTDDYSGRSVGLGCGYCRIRVAGRPSASFNLKLGDMSEQQSLHKIRVAFAEAFAAV